VPLVALCLPAVALTACSNSSTSATTTTVSAAGRTLCTTVTPAQIAAATGLKVQPAQTSSVKTSVTCTYKATELSKSVIILYSIDVTAADFTSQAKRANTAHGPITHIKHLGDAAYYFTVPAQDTTITTLVVIHGQAEIVITSTASINQIADLARTILATFTSKE
jgi:hypothetical protein